MALPQDPMTPEMETEPMDDGSYTICISVKGDGTMFVTEEMGAEEEQGEPVTDIDAALAKAMSLYQAKSGDQAGKMSVEQAFSAGFNEGRPV